MITGEEAKKVFTGERRYIPNPLYPLIISGDEESDYFQLLVLLENKPGSASRMFEYLERSGFDIVIAKGYPFNDLALFTCHFRVKREVGLNAKAVEDEIKALRGVLNVILAKLPRLSKPIYFDIYHFPLVCREHRMLTIPAEIFYYLRAHLLERLDTGGAALLHEAGLKASTFIFDELLSSLGSLEDKLIVSQEVYRVLGWGIMEMSLTQREGEIVIRENLEAKGADLFGCNFTRGLLTGLLRKIFSDETIKLREVECASTGKPYCRFILL